MKPLTLGKWRIVVKLWIVVKCLIVEKYLIVVMRRPRFRLR